MFENKFKKLLEESNSEENIIAHKMKIDQENIIKENIELQKFKQEQDTKKALIQAEFEQFLAWKESRK